MCATPTRLALVTPVYQDWESLALLLAELARVGREAGLRFHVVAVNDSPTPAPAVPLDAATGAIIEHLTVLDLVRNLGHQRAIASLLRHKGRMKMISKEKWVSIMRSAGFTEDDMRRWHREFEKAAPEDHQEFLEFLHIGKEEIATIRQWSRG